MGRPLSKKYFGNRNIGTTGTADDHIGGEGVASISNGTVGSININDTYKTFPALLVAAPELPGGVTSLTQVTWEIESISIGGTNTGYTNSQTGSAATLTGLNGYISGPTFTINTTYNITPGSSHSKLRSYEKCFIMQTVPVIGADLGVYACHNKAYDQSGLIGSLKDCSFRDLWFSDKTKQFMNTFNAKHKCMHECSNDRKNILINHVIEASSDNYI
jgi:hypothetical protein